jgi:hypothetical protein
LDNPEFVKQLHRMQVDLVERTAGMLTGAGPASVKTLVDLQQDASVSSPVRRRAARDVLELGIKYREAAIVEPRVAALEERLSNPHAQENGV